MNMPGLSNPIAGLGARAFTRIVRFVVLHDRIDEVHARAERAIRLRPRP